MNWQLLVFFSFAGALDVYAQEIYLGASSEAMANASATSSDVLSVFNNPGSLGFVEKDQFATGYRTFYQVEGWQTIYASANKQLGKGALGIGFSKFGDDLYQTNSAVIGFGHRLGIASLGVSVHYENLMIPGFGSASSFPVDVGGKVEFSPSFFLSSGVKNINQAKRTNNTEERFPSTYLLGFLYNPTQSLNITGQVDYSILRPVVLRTGLDYTVRMIHLRLGVQTQPIQWSAGLGIEWRRFVIDYAFRPHTTLGGSHFFTITYSYAK